MEYRSLAIGVVATLLVVSTIGAGLSISSSEFMGNESVETETATATPTPAPTVSEDEVPDDVKASLDGAEALKMNLSKSETFDDSNVSITREGEIVVRYNSQASSGPELKEEMAEVAMRYSAVVGDHPDTGGLTVAANGVKLMVSSDAAEAHGGGKIKDDAFTQTFHWSSYEQQSGSQEGDE